MSGWIAIVVSALSALVAIAAALFARRSAKAAERSAAADEALAAAAADEAEERRRAQLPRLVVTEVHVRPKERPGESLVYLQLHNIGGGPAYAVQLREVAFDGNGYPVDYPVGLMPPNKLGGVQVAIPAAAQAIWAPRSSVTVTVSVRAGDGRPVTEALEPFEGAMAALEQLARDLPHVDADTAYRRLARLSADQRAIVDAAIGELLGPDLAPPKTGENGGSGAPPA